MRFNSRWRRRAALAAAWLGALGLAGCGRYPQSTFTPAGIVAKVELQLFELGLWVVIPIGLFVFGVLIYIVWRFRARPGDDEVPLQVSGNGKLEVGWTVAFILILAVITVPNLKDTFFAGDQPAASANPLYVTVTGHQFWWQMTYPDQHVVTANELHIPVGRPVDVSLTSVDVIHAFWVPALGGKTDSIPGRINHMWIEADKPGVYQGQCAEFCGTSHANMRFLVDAQSPGAFDQWVQAMQHPDVTPATALAKQGQELFLKTEPCSACHTLNGTSAQGTIGPNLTGIGSRGLIAAFMPNTDANLARWLADPPAVKPGEGGVDPMPDLHLKPNQIQALVAYLEGLKT